MDSAGAIRSFTGFSLSFYIFFISIIFLLFPPFSYIFFPDRALGILISTCDGLDTLGTFFYSSNTFVSVCIYVSIGEVIKVYVGAGWVVFSSFFFPFNRVYFSCHWAGAFSFFIQTGFYGVLHIIKHIFFFLIIFFIFAFPPQEHHLLDISPLLHLFFRSIGRSDLVQAKGRGRKEGRG